MGKTDVETGPDNAIPQTPTHNGEANVRRAGSLKLVIKLMVGGIKLVEGGIKDYYLPVFLGMFGVFALQAAEVANDQSLVANQLALLSLCSGNSSINQCEALLTQTDLYLPAIINTLYDIRRPPSTVMTVSARTSKFGVAGSRSIGIIYAVMLISVSLLVLCKAWGGINSTAQTEEKPSDSLAQGYALIEGQVAEGAASNARA